MSEDTDMNHSLHVGQEPELRTYAVRWCMLAIYMLLGLNNQSCWLTFSTVSKGAAKRYDVTEDWITAQTTSVTVLFFPGAWICSRALAGRKGSLRRAVIVGATLQVAGGLARWLGDALCRPWSPRLGFALTFLGQDLAALGAPCFMNTPAVLAEDWFAAHEREPAMSAAVFSPIVGQGLGSVISGFVATGDRGEGLGYVLSAQAATSVLLFLWAWLQFQSKPPTPPTMTKHETPAETRVLVTWARVIRRPQFLLLLAIFDTGTAIAAAVLTLYSQLARSCGYGTGIAGGASGLYTICGVVGALITGSVMGRTRAYRTCLRTTVAGAVVAGFCFLASMRPNNSAVLLSATGAFGGMLMSCMPTLITNAVEETYPVSADACTALLFLTANLLQTAVTPALQAVHNSEPVKCGGLFAPSRLFILGLAVFGCLVPAIAYRGECRRKMAEDRVRQEAHDMPALS